MRHEISEDLVRTAMEVARVPLAASAGQYGRKSLEWEPFTCTFVVSSCERLVSAGKDLKAAVAAYNDEP